MRQRMLGRTGQMVSEIAFGCGNVGGLLIRGDQREQVRAVERAIEHGITYFDTAAGYGDGVSEQSLGRALAELNADVMVGTKLQLGPDDLAAGSGHIRRLFEASLSRLGRKSVDILYYHGRIRRSGQGTERPGRPERALAADQVLGPLLDVFHEFRRDGQVRFLGFTGLGDTDAVLEAIQPDAYDVMHCYFSAVNPSAGHPVSTAYQPQNLGGMLDRAATVGMGVLAIRILAAGAAAGATPRHPIAGGTGGTLISGTDYDADVERAERLRPIADELGISLPELAIRFALSKPELSTALVGISSVDQVDFAVRAADVGPLPPAIVERIVLAADEG
jgi:aryl-alcohol dehydrogenase-like predicted oxidoreductase